MAKSISKKHRKILMPTAERLEGIRSEIIAMKTEELRDMDAACRAVSESNCWFMVSEAANLVRYDVACELLQRERLALIKKTKKAVGG